LPVSSAGSRQRANRWFWLLCVVTSASSVVILLTLLLSIVVQALPVFFPSEARYASAINEGETQIAELNSQLEAIKNSYQNNHDQTNSDQQRLM